MSEEDKIVRLVLGEISGRAHKDDWIAQARAAFKPSPRSPCFVCGKFRSIAQAHHIIPLARQYDRGFETVNHSHVWLCPNHHTVIHAFIAGDKVTRDISSGAKLLEESVSGERAALYELFMWAFEVT